MSTNKPRRHLPGESPALTLWKVGGGVLAAAVFIVWLWNGKAYPETTSPEGLKLIRALYTACSSRSERRLSQVERSLLAIDSAGKLTAAERAAFESIIEHARTGNWEQASADSYQFAQDQVR